MPRLARLIFMVVYFMLSLPRMTVPAGFWIRSVRISPMRCRLPFRISLISDWSDGAAWWNFWRKFMLIIELATEILLSRALLKRHGFYCAVCLICCYFAIRIILMLNTSVGWLEKRRCLL